MKNGKDMSLEEIKEFVIENWMTVSKKYNNLIPTQRIHGLLKHNKIKNKKEIELYFYIKKLLNIPEEAKPSEVIYWLIYNIKEFPLCPICKKKLKFMAFNYRGKDSGFQSACNSCTYIVVGLKNKESLKGNKNGQFRINTKHSEETKNKISKKVNNYLNSLSKEEKWKNNASKTEFNSFQDIINFYNKNGYRPINFYEDFETLGKTIPCIDKLGQTVLKSVNNIKRDKKYKNKNKISKNENLIKKVLLKYNISFVKEKYFLDFYSNSGKKKAFYRFDFYLPDYNLCIEYDSKYHFKPIKYFGEINFEKVKAKDMLKNAYCSINNINLIRIPYWKKDNIEKILIKKLNIKKEL